VNASFTQKWLDADTYIDKLNPIQAKRVRELCEKFYEAGRRVGAGELPAPPTAEEPTL
jgi:hypothetical protein